MLVPRWLLALPLAAVFLAGCPDRRMDRARALAAEGRLEEAGELYFDLAKDDPANLAAWDGALDIWCREKLNVGQCMEILDLELQILGTLQRHKDVLSEVLELRARARIESGLLEAALADLARAENASPARASVFTAKGKALAGLGRSQEALEALTTAKRLDPESAEADELLKALPGADTPEVLEIPPPEDSFGGD